MNTTQLECFLAVADTLNFSRAAERLNITQPAVSHQIAALEDELGVKLFHRTSKTVRLTHEGYLFTQYAGEILKLAGLSRTRLKKSLDAQTLHLGVGCRNALEMRLLQGVLSRLCREYPALMPIPRLVPFNSIENLLDVGDIQVLLSFRENRPKQAVYQELALCPVACVCREDHPLAAYSSLTLQQLQQGGRLAVCHPPACPPALFACQNQIIPAHDPSELLFCNSLEAAETLAAAGLAFALLPDFPRTRAPGLRYLPVPELPPQSFGVACASGRRSPLLRRFIALLGEALQPDGQV